MYGAGARVGFFQGDIRLLPDDMKFLQPTIFPVVPRLLNRVYDKVSDLSPDSASDILQLVFKVLIILSAGSKWRRFAFQEKAVELCCGQEIC